jgi:uncharacterized membrane protein
MMPKTTPPHPSFRDAENNCADAALSAGTEFGDVNSGTLYAILAEILGTMIH